MAKFSKDKGRRGEILWSSFCREHGYDVHRTAQYCGKTGDAGDCVGLPGIHQEVKFVERLNIRDALTQSIFDADAEGEHNLPIVAHKMSNRPWLVTMRAEDWFSIYREYESGMSSDGADVPQETI